MGLWQPAGVIVAVTWLALLPVSAGDRGGVDEGALTAGVFTVDVSDETAYTQPVPVLTGAQLEIFAKGREQFRERWVVAPDPDGVWGLGPTFNEDRCVHCHENNGRARAPMEDVFVERGLLVRLSVPGVAPDGGPQPHPAYGDQLQNRGVLGRVPAEGKAVIRYEPRTVTYENGEPVVLRRPVLELRDLQFGELGGEVMTSLRVAPAMVGLGLLEAVPETVILDIARRQTAQGVSGRPNYVRDHESGADALGRFGWKANQPNLRQQVAAAFHGDIGATTYLFPEENCPAVQVDCLALPSASKCGGQGGCTGNMFRPEVVPSRLANITLYLQGLGVPARRAVDDREVKRGEHLFDAAGCAACHVPTMETGAAVLASASNVTIRPYTDLLLHDMGEALADNRPDFRADGREWRTPPLWGIGLLNRVNGHFDLLHDGRARGVAEAIFWHGGEAENAREAFRRMPPLDRAALVRFVESL